MKITLAAMGDGAGEPNAFVVGQRGPAIVHDHEIVLRAFGLGEMNHVHGIERYGFSLCGGIPVLAREKKAPGDRREARCRGHRRAREQEVRERVSLRILSMN